MKTSIIKFYSIEEVAEMLAVSKRTVRRWIADKKLVSHKFGRARRIADDDLNSFVALRRAS